MNSSEFLKFFKDQLTDETAEISLQTEFKKLTEWDSLTAMLIITNLKEDLNIDLGLNDLLNCNTIEDLYKLTSNK